MPAAHLGSPLLSALPPSLSLDPSSSYRGQEGDTDFLCAMAVSSYREKDMQQGAASACCRCATALMLLHIVASSGGADFWVASDAAHSQIVLTDLEMSESAVSEESEAAEYSSSLCSSAKNSCSQNSSSPAAKAAGG